MDSAQDTLAGGLPHSEIPGSPIARISPGLFAACHVLHRLSVPRHPPDALASRLITASPSPAMPHHRRAQGQTPCLPPQQRRAAVSMKTLLSDKPWRKLRLRHPRAPATLALCRKGPSSACARPCPPRSHHNSLFTLQSTPPRSPAAVSRNLLRTSGAPSRSGPAAPLGAAPLHLLPAKTHRQQKLELWQGPARPVVEVNGFEPMTSCLQSRRSPS